MSVAARRRRGAAATTAAAAGVSSLCASRLAKEYAKLAREPPQFVTAVPDPSNIRELHFVVHGVPDTPYQHGYYHGMLRFPREYPMAPPAVFMYTPSGRFETGKRLCLSMSDYHPETWNPMWSVATILLGFVSFMSEESDGAGSIRQSTTTRQRLAATSLAWNVRHTPIFSALFPDLAEQHRRSERAAAAAAENKVVDADGNVIARAKRGSTAVAVNALMTGNSAGRDRMLVVALCVSLSVIAVLLLVVYHYRDAIRSLNNVATPTGDDSNSDAFGGLF